MRKSQGHLLRVRECADHVREWRASANSVSN
nr:MAG TPA: hypothetical protein [Caudoviricetes sp.]